MRKIVIQHDEANESYIVTVNEYWHGTYYSPTTLMYNLSLIFVDTKKQTQLDGCDSK